MGRNRNMRLFDNFNEYKEKIQIVTENKLKNINCFYLPQEVIQLIKEKRLFYMANDDIFQILEENENYFKVCFYSKDEVNFIKFNTTKPVLVDLPYNNKKNEKFVNIEKKLKKQGFVLNCESSRMVKLDHETKKIDDNIFKNYTIEKIKESDICFVLEIWKENFDMIKNLLYGKEELLKHIEDIYICKDEKNKIVGAMEIVINGKTGWIQKIAIDKKCQGRGIGSYMEIFYINLCNSLGINKFLLYTLDDDYKAQNFHKKFGFSFDGKHNCQYIYRR